MTAGRLPGRLGTPFQAGQDVPGCEIVVWTEITSRQGDRHAGDERGFLQRSQ